MHSFSFTYTKICITVNFNFSLKIFLDNGCFIPANPDNGYVDTDLDRVLVGTFIRYFCNENYTMEGQESSECLSNKTWFPPAPQCVSKYSEIYYSYNSFKKKLSLTLKAVFSSI